MDQPDRPCLATQNLGGAGNVHLCGQSFADANNTVANPLGATGLVPSYQLWDLSVNWRFLKNYSLSSGINNIADKKYFTRRINMYPGPGILPADGRSFYITAGVKL